MKHLSELRRTDWVSLKTQPEGLALGAVLGVIRGGVEDQRGNGEQEEESWKGEPQGAMVVVQLKGGVLAG